MSKLVIFLPDAGEVVYELTEAMISVGRIEDNIIQITDASVSTHHAEFVLSGGEYVLKDLESTNGTRVNGKRVAEAKLCPGDRVRFGSVEGVFEPDVKGAGLPLPPLDENTPQVMPADQSQRPEGFGNASPFARKTAERDVFKIVAIAAGVLALVAAAIAIYLALGLQVPSF